MLYSKLKMMNVEKKSNTFMYDLILLLIAYNNLVQTVPKIR